MALILFCATAAFFLHLFALLALNPRRPSGRLLPLLIMEGLLLVPAIQCVVEKPSDFVFSWADKLALIGFMALAVLAGSLAALAVYRKTQ